MAYVFVTATQVKNRLSWLRVDRFLDDDGTGTAKTAVETQFREDASSFVARYLGSYSLTEIETKAGANTAHEVVRLTLDALAWMLVKRHGEIAPNLDWYEMRKANVSDLEDLRKRWASLDTTVAQSGAPAVECEDDRGWGSVL